VLLELEEWVSVASTAIGAVERLALVINSSQEAETAEATSSLVSEIAGLRLPFGDGTDMVFQINRRKSLSLVPGCELNQLMRWSADHIQQIEISSGPPKVQSLEIATLSVDVNTVPTTRTFPVSEQALIFRDMNAEALRLSQANSVSALE
jgi:hypothetical protein